MKVWLYFGDKRVEKRKTPVYKCTLEPVFNETFTFNVPWEKIRECSLDVRVMDFDNIGRNELIGRISLTGEPRLSTLSSSSSPLPPPHGRDPTRKSGNAASIPTLPRGYAPHLSKPGA